MKSVMFILLAVLLVPSVGASQDCIDYGGDYLRWAGSLSTPEGANIIVVNGSYAYIGIGYSGLLVADISEPESPVALGVVDVPGCVCGLTVHGNYAYLGDCFNGLWIADISVPSSPVIVGSVSSENGGEVAVSGNYAYFAGGSGLQVIDISDPEYPAVIGSAIIPDPVWGVEVSGNFAYLACFGSEGLLVMDISVPESPALVGSVFTSDKGLNLTVSESYAYLTMSGGGLQVIDISMPESPAIVGAAETNGSPYGIAVAGSFAYVTGWLHAGLQVFDISDPTVPEAIGAMGNPGEAWDVAVAEDFAYMADGSSGLQVIDVTYPGSPPIAGSVDTPDNVEEIAVSDNLICAACPNEFLVIEVSSAGSPVVLGALGPPSYGQYRDVAASDDFAYLTMGWPSQVLAVSLAIPDSPDVISTLETGGEAHGIASENHFVYVANGLSGLQVLDFTVPESPSISSNFMTTAAAKLVAVAGGMAYVALGDGYGFNGLEVIDVSDPAWPTHMGVVETPGVSSDVVVVDDHVYTGLGEHGLRIIDVSEPTTPVIVGSWENGAEITGVSVFGSYAYLSQNFGSLWVLDVSSPSSPSFEGSVFYYGYSRDVVCDGERVIVARGMDGLQTYWPQCGEASGIRDNLDNDVPGHMVGLRIYPNPFNPQTTISFDLDRAEWVKTTVFDLTGHRVKVLTDRQFMAGTHSITWNGRDSHGRDVPSGAYIVRVETGSRVSTRKAVLIK